MTTENVTPLLQVMRCCTTAEQHELGRLAGTTRNYLYQLATGHRMKMSVGLAVRISKATTTMHLRTFGKIPKISLEQLATLYGDGPQ